MEYERLAVKLARQTNARKEQALSSLKKGWRQDGRLAGSPRQPDTENPVSVPGNCLLCLFVFGNRAVDATPSPH